MEPAVASAVLTVAPELAETNVKSTGPVALILRPDAAKLLGISVSTAKRRELEDEDFPSPLMLSPTRIAYRSDRLAQYPSILQQRRQERSAEQKPGIARDARRHGLDGVKARRAKAEAAKQAKAEASSAASRGNGSPRQAVVPAPVPVAVQPEPTHPSRRDVQAKARRDANDIGPNKTH